MGLGGNLIWTGVFKAVSEEHGKPVLAACAPRLSDLLHGRLYDSAVDLGQDPIFRNNPRLVFPPAHPKGIVDRFLDLCWQGVTRPQSIKRAVERTLFRLIEHRNRTCPSYLIHIDMLIHSYADKQLANRFIWKQGGHAIEVISRRFTNSPTDLKCELYFEAEEIACVASLLTKSNLTDPFIVVEPDTNREWFGDLRAWPHERWQALMDRLKIERPNLQIVQIGLKSAQPLTGVVDLRGLTTFREAALVLREAALFVGTEGGMMHAANAVSANALILWGGVTLPEFAGYPETQTILCNHVPCAPCGHLGWCDNEHQCMLSISVDDVLEAVVKAIPEGTARAAER